MAKKKTKKGKVSYHVAAGVMDVIRAALSCLVIILMILLLTSLGSWVISDINVTFSDLTDGIGSAVFQLE